MSSRIGEHDETAFRRPFGSSRLNVRMCRIFGTWVSGPRTSDGKPDYDRGSERRDRDWQCDRSPDRDRIGALTDEMAAGNLGGPPKSSMN